MPLGMHFKKMYCCKCGNKLDKKSLPVVSSSITTKIRRNVFTLFPIYDDLNSVKLTKVKSDSYLYHCKQCNYLMTYEHQNKVRKYQKKHGKLLLTEAEIKSLGVSFRA